MAGPSWKIQPGASRKRCGGVGQSASQPVDQSAGSPVRSAGFSLFSRPAARLLRRMGLGLIITHISPESPLRGAETLRCCIHKGFARAGARLEHGSSTPKEQIALKRERDRRFWSAQAMLAPWPVSGPPKGPSSSGTVMASYPRSRDLWVMIRPWPINRQFHVTRVCPEQAL
jgi:hypothetical protein